MVKEDFTPCYFNNKSHGPTDGYTQEPAQAYVQKERQRNNQDELDKQLFLKLEREYQIYLNTLESNHKP